MGTEKIEVRRQLFHVALGIVLVGLLYFGVMDWFGAQPPLSTLSPLPPPARPLGLVLVMGAALVLLSRKYKLPGVYWFLERFERPEARRVFPGRGAFFYILGAFVVISLLEKPIAMASIMILALGDSSSHLIGGYIGRMRHPFSDTKFIEGHVAGALIGTCGAMFFVPPLVALVGAAVAMFAEGIDVGFGGNWILDDNLVVPVVAGAVIFLLL